MSLFKHKHILILLGILILAFILRFWQLGSLPSFHADEADFADNAYALLRTGKDQFGQSFLFGTTSTGDFRPAGYVYLAALSIGLFGFNELGTRLPTLVFALLTIVAVYVLALELWKDKEKAIVTSFLLTTSFWHITLSREASEKIVALFFITVGIWALIKYFDSCKPYLLLSAFISFFISIHTYYSPRSFLLLFVPAVLVIYHNKLNRFQRTSSLVAGALLLVLIIFFTFFYQTSSERLKQLSIFNNPQTEAVLQEQINEDGSNGNIFLSRVFHNKLLGYSFAILNNYADYLSGKFLFLEGGYPARVRIPQVGLLNIVELPFLLYGLFIVLGHLKEKRHPENRLLLIWAVLAVLPAALTFDEIPNVYRTALLLPALNLITAYGFIAIVRSFRQKRMKIAALIIIGILYAGMFVYYAHQYSTHYEVHHPWFRNWAQKQLAEAIQQDYTGAQWIFVPQLYGGVEQMMRFYLGFKPQPKVETLVGTGRFETFRNIIFTPEICPYPRLLKDKVITDSPNYVYVDAPECHKLFQPTDKVEHVVTWKDGNPAYEILRGKLTP